MSFYDDDEDPYGNPEGNARQNPLRKVVNDLEKKLEKEAKARQEAEDKLAAATRAVSQRTVADVLKDKGANPGLARYVLADVQDPTPEAVERWLTTEGELFGYKPAPPAEDPATKLGLPAGTALPPDLVAAMEKFQATQQGGVTAPTGADAIAAKLADPNLTRAELEALITAG